MRSLVIILLDEFLIFSMIDIEAFHNFLMIYWLLLATINT
jgi:hypothetical protein